VAVCGAAPRGSLDRGVRDPVVGPPVSPRRRSQLGTQPDARLELDPDPEGATTWIHIVDARYAFTPDLFVKLFLQTNSAIDKENVQATFVWRFMPPFGSLQIAFQRGTSELGQVSDQGDTLFTKLAWVF
jgi:hypothetical protein